MTTVSCSPSSPTPRLKTRHRGRRHPRIFGLFDWVRGVTDRLPRQLHRRRARFLWGMGPKGAAPPNWRACSVRRNPETAADQVTADLARRQYASKLPACNARSWSLAFCWGGGQVLPARDDKTSKRRWFLRTPPRGRVSSMILPVGRAASLPA